MSMDTLRARAASCATPSTRASSSPACAAVHERPAQTSSWSPLNFAVSKDASLAMRTSDCGHSGSSHRDLVPCQGKAHSMPGKFGRGQLRASEMRTPCRGIPCVEMLTLWLDLVKLTSIVPETPPLMASEILLGDAVPAAVPEALKVSSSQLPERGTPHMLMFL